MAAAIVGASRPEQVTDSATAAGVVLGADAMRAIDDVLGDVVERVLEGPLSPTGRP